MYKESDNQTCIIWDSCEPSPRQIENVIFWGLGGNDDSLYSVQSIVEENDDKYRSRYLSFVHNMGQVKLKGKTLIEYLDVGQDMSFWWMTTISEKCNFSKSPYIEDIIKLMAFSDWIKDQSYSKYILVSDNTKLSQAISLLLKQNNISFKFKKSTKKYLYSEFSFRKLFRKFPNIAQSVLWLVKNIVTFYSLSNVGIEKWKNSNAKTTFVSYSAYLNPSSSIAGDFESHYWGILPKMLQNKHVETNWIHFYVEDRFIKNTKIAKKVLRGFNINEDGVRNHVALQSFINARVVLNSFGKWIYLLLKYYSVKKIIRIYSKIYFPLIHSDIKKSILGTNAVSNIFYHNLFSAAFSLLPNQTNCYYVQENQGWEFGMINAWKNLRRHGKIVGVPHSTVRYWDLRHYYDKRTLSQENKFSIPSPDMVALNGDAAVNLYLEADYEKEKIIKVEALRYFHLININKSLQSKIKIEKSIKLLVLGDYLFKNTHQQLNLLRDAYSQSRFEIDIFFKPHPMCTIDTGFYPDLSMTIVNESIQDIVSKFSVIYTSSRTSAVVDAYYSGAFIITFLDRSMLNSSPLRGWKNVTFVNTIEELVHGINQGQKNEERLINSEYFYLNSDITRWKDHFYQFGVI